MSSRIIAYHIYTGFILIALMGSTTQADATSWERVQHTFDRCARTFNKTSQRFRRFSHELSRSNTFALNEASTDSLELKKKWRTLSQKKDYLKSRIDRLHNSRQRLEQEIVQGKRSSTSCPNCTQSDIRLFCRQTEALNNQLEQARRELNAYLQNLGHACELDTMLRALQDTARILSRRNPERSPLYSYALRACDSARVLLNRNKKIDALRLITSVRDTLFSSNSTSESSAQRIEAQILRAESMQEKTGNETTGKILVLARSHYRKGKQHKAANEPEKARKQFHIARRFVEKALQKLEKNAH